MASILSLPKLKHTYTLAGYDSAGDIFCVQRPLVPTEDNSGTILLQVLTDLAFSAKISKKTDGTYVTPSIRDGKLHLIIRPPGSRQYERIRSDFETVATFDISVGTFDPSTRRFTAPEITGVPLTIEFGTYPINSNSDATITICCPTIIGSVATLPKAA